MQLPADVTSASCFVCQQVLKDQDNLITAVRIFDVITVRKIPTADTAIIDLYAVALVRTSATEPSSRRMTVELVSPSGARGTFGWNEVLFDSQGGNGHPIGATMVVQFRLSIEKSGLYWVSIALDGEQIALMPLTLQIETIETP
jgi:hypothetical protein